MKTKNQDPPLRRWHAQATITLRGKETSVDIGIRSLILMLNKVPGLETYSCCQGGARAGVGFVRYNYYDPHRVDYGAYVTIGGNGAFRILPHLAQAILQRQREWKRKHRHVCNGCRGMTVKLEVGRGGIAMRWQPWDYHMVKAMVATAGEAVSLGSVPHLMTNSAVSARKRKRGKS